MEPEGAVTKQQVGSVNDRDRSPMMTLGRVVFWLGLGLAALPTAAFIALLVEASYKPNYDVNSPDYGRYSEVFARLREQLDQRDPTDEDILDFAALNGGQWTTACLFGGYTHPLDEMLSREAVIDNTDRVRLTEARSRGVRLGTVEEFEALIAYIDLRNRAHFIHFSQGIGPSGQHFEQCISKPNTTIYFR